MSNISFSEDAWAEYIYWQNQDKRVLKKINELIRDIIRNGVTEGIGHPEPLKYKKGAYSREIDKKNRLVYTEIEGVIVISACKGHYDDK